MTGVTQILASIERGDPHAAEQLLPLVYDELRKLAAARMAHERADHTLQPTALVHEAYVRLVDTDQAQHWNSRGHFFGAAAEAMRRILVENARRKRSEKHGGGHRQIELADVEESYLSGGEQVLEIAEALEQLAAEDARAARLVELRYFAGLSVEEAAALLEIPRSTAYEHWAYARASLRLKLQTDRNAGKSEK